MNLNRIIPQNEDDAVCYCGAPLTTENELLNQQCVECFSEHLKQSTLETCEELIRINRAILRTAAEMPSLDCKLDYLFNELQHTLLRAGYIG